jgi:hypothetical protein
MGVLHLLHPLVDVDLPLFINDFHLKTKVTLDWETFISTLVCSPRLSSNGFSGMVYEFLRDYFVLHDSMNGFDLFFKVCRGTLFKVMFHLQYCVYFLHLKSLRWRNNLKAYVSSRLVM